MAELPTPRSKVKFIRGRVVGQLDHAAQPFGEGRTLERADQCEHRIAFTLPAIITDLRGRENHAGCDRDRVDQICQGGDVHGNNLSDVDFGGEEFCRAFSSALQDRPQSLQQSSRWSKNVVARGSVAQSVEQRPFKALVPGSSPGRPSLL